MITKNDIIILLTDLETKGLNVKKQLNDLFKSNEISLDVIKFINDNRQFDLASFYELIRNNYNKKKSKLYKNIVKEDLNNPKESVTTLSALCLQINLFASKLKDDRLFIKHSRAEEITQALNNYYKTYDLIPCIKVLKLIKADLKAFENIKD